MPGRTLKNSKDPSARTEEFRTCPPPTPPSKPTPVTTVAGDPFGKTTRPLTATPAGTVMVKLIPVIGVPDNTLRTVAPFIEDTPG